MRGVVRADREKHQALSEIRGRTLVRSLMRRRLLRPAESIVVPAPPAAGVLPIRRRPSGPSPDREWRLTR
jgi:hypothetical protein